MSETPSNHEFINRLLELLSKATISETDGVVRCREEARILGPDGRDGGGHWACLQPLDENGVCPNAKNHHSVYIRNLPRP